MTSHRILADFRCALLSVVVLLSLPGCALVTRGTQQNIRVEAVSSEGKAIDTLECRASDGSSAAAEASAPGVTVKRSVQDLLISCLSQGQLVASAKIVSRADWALLSLVVGGLTSAVIDHVSGAVYAYPEWIRLVAGEERVYDQRDSAQGPLGGTFARRLGAPGNVADRGAGIPVVSKAADPLAVYYRANYNVKSTSLREPGGRATGRDTYNAEKLAASMHCSATPRAVLVERGGGFELHRVACAGGDELSVRCEYGACRVQPTVVAAPVTALVAHSR